MENLSPDKSGSLLKKDRKVVVINGALILLENTYEADKFCFSLRMLASPPTL
ncbi:hypothetical protein [Sphingobacterium spiritivorum]|uniref:hypothetical protein n=1 Tax=Sphingobacterium spiritivorum TaxID=258 RepID=UPI0015F1890B|nr:hypothetical protein [Sphingobacterium spiritivorum]